MFRRMGLARASFPSVVGVLLLALYPAHCNYHTITILGESEPDVIEVLRSAYKPVPKIQKVEEIGSLFHHTFTVHNTGEWPSQDSRLLVQWPYSVRNPQEVEEQLTYFESDIIVQDLSTGLEILSNCSLPEILHNPPKFAKKRRSVTPTDQLSNTKGQTPFSKAATSPWHFHLSCNHSRVNCVPLTCDLPPIGADQKIVVKIAARLWESTLIQDLAPFHTIHIHSLATLYLNPPLELRHKRSLPAVYVTSAELTAVIEPVRSEDPGRNWEGPFFGIVFAAIILLLVIFTVNARRSAKFREERHKNATNRRSRTRSPARPMYSVVKFAKVAEPLLEGQATTTV
ncbi:integrin alpha ina-1-like isoform X2 [Paramacrobiotus metropolitanus]|nr:integrin alpha ina-1-like isoform X2 [Paramacrobiotus metropolitanus]